VHGRLLSMPGAYCIARHAHANGSGLDRHFAAVWCSCRSLRCKGPRRRASASMNRAKSPKKRKATP
jgi:hypothetical protein